MDLGDAVDHNYFMAFWLVVSGIMKSMSVARKPCMKQNS